MSPLLKIPVVALALFSSSVLAGHHGSIGYNEPPPFAPPIALPTFPVVEEPKLPSTPPHAVDESPRIVRCPPDFKNLGKQCVKTVFTEPSALCPPGTVRTNEAHGEQCARFLPKIVECPPAFEREHGICTKTIQTDAIIECRDDFTLTPDGRRCVRSVPLPPIAYCPPGTIQKGDYCASQELTHPNLVCPPAYILEGNRCITEETYDCTPPRGPPRKEEPVYVRGPENPIPPQIYAHGKKHHLRMLGEEKHGHDYVPNISKGTPPPTLDEYVVNKTCKRIRTEAARRICPPGALLEGKHCVIENQQPLLTRPGGFKEEFSTPLFECPHNFVPSSPVGRFVCILNESVPPKVFCPAGTTDVGHKCAIFHEEVYECPHEYQFEEGKCVKTIFAPPQVEYTVTYKCTGKDCANPHNKGTQQSYHHKY